MSTGFQAALFDFDGTLVDSEPRSRWAWKRLFATYEVPLSDAELKTFSGRRGQDVIAERQHLFPGHGVQELFEEAMSYWAIAEVPKATAIPGAVELVQAIHAANVPAAIVSSARRGEIDELLHELGMHDLFAVIIGSEDVTDGKPSPEGYLAACARLGVEPPHTVVFEDAPAGVTAAKAAGAACVAVTTTRPAAKLADADLVVADLAAVSWPVTLLAAPTTR